MSPVIERVAKGKRNRARPRQKLFMGGSVTCAGALRDSVSPHRSPFVVITFQPYLGEVLKPPIFGDIARGQVRVIIEDRFVSGIAVVKTAAGFRVQEEVVVDE